MIRSLPLTILAALTVASAAAAQRLSLPTEALADSAALAAELPRLADEAARADDGEPLAVRLEHRVRLRMVAGRYDDAADALAQWRAGWRDTTARGRAFDLQYEIFVDAKRLEAHEKVPFADAFARAFRNRVGALDDGAAALAVRSFGVFVPPVPERPDGAEDGPGGITTIPVADAVAWLRARQIASTYREIGSLAQPLIREDDARRYHMTTDIRVRTPGGATVCAIVWRPRNGPARAPALLQFTIYADTVALMGEARRTAASGYVSVLGFTRGKLCSPDTTVPYVHEGKDAAALVDWISDQPWSDGRVGMYGGSYSGMTPWAAAKERPPALKAIMVGAPVAPGIDVPMEGNIVWNFVYPWPFYTTTNKTLDDTTYNDRARWRRVDRAWYESGRAYREMDKIDGTPNPVWDEWLRHPAYDGYWKAMIPSGREFSRIRIPVLQTAGYYYGGPGAALYYLTEHYKSYPNAAHYLLIGPYDHFQAQRGVVTALGDTATVLSGYEIDPVARIDIVSDLRYQWFDWVFKDGPRPGLLADRINYEVVDGNRWKHAPSVAAMSNGTLRLYLSAEPAGDRYRLTGRSPSSDSSVTLTVDLADRSDSNRFVPGGGVADTAIDTASSLVYVGDPLPAATEVSGLFSGHLEIVTNKRDFDFGIAVYEQRSDGTYMQIPPYQSRASHVGSVSTRRLLTPGRRERLDFRSIRLASHRCRKGSRMVVIVSVLKSPGQQINYGTGKDVSDETVADAGEPLTIRWYDSSYIELPVRR